MSLSWTHSARRDLERLHNFVAAADPNAARRTLHLLLNAAKRVAPMPRVGARLTEFSPREVRRLIIGDYELRYELRDGDVLILRIWHVHEDR